MCETTIVPRATWMGAITTEIESRKDRLGAGGVRINGAPSHGLGDIPFGGVKDTGIDREGIAHTTEAFTTTRSIVL